VNRWLAGLVGVTGVGAIGAGLVLAVALTPVTASEAGGGALLLVLTGVTVAAVKLSRSSAGGAAIAPPPWDEDGGLVDGTPEETADPADVTGDELAALVDDARERAREAETVEEGFAVVRPPLRDALTRVLVADGTAPDDVDEALATGAWTDDPVAAAVVDERVDLPRVSLRQRLRAWLFPERVVRRGTARAVAAVDGAAERELPPVVGRDAPRTVPTLAPALGSLRRAADGTVQRAETVGRHRSDEDGDATDGSGDDVDGDANGAAGGGRSIDGRDDSDDPGAGAGAADREDLLGEVWDDA